MRRAGEITMVGLQLAAAFNSHRQGSKLVAAGRAHRDQLLRALLPLYVMRGRELEVTSGDVSRYWKTQGVKFGSPAVAKVTREHIGYVRHTKIGRQITPNGVKYVEAMLKLKP